MINEKTVLGRHGSQSSATHKHLLDRIRESNFFLTAKGKIFDTYELHAFGVGVLLGSLRFLVPGQFRAGYWALVIGAVGMSMGLEFMRPKDVEVLERAKELGAPSLRRQIRKEGQYFILGLFIGLSPSLLID